MIYTHFVGRIGKDAQVVTGTHGSFLSFDIAVDNFEKGQKVTTWIRVRSNNAAHINLSQWLTKGKMLIVEGTLNSPTIWTDKNGKKNVQLSIKADNMNFITIGKKNEDNSQPEQQEQVTAVTPTEQSLNEDPLGGPTDTSDDLPF